MAHSTRRLMGGVIWVIGTLACIGTFYQVSASTPGPPSPDSSCASAEYTVEKMQQQSSTTGGRTDSPTLIVVSGKEPINTTKQINMGRPVTVCVMGLYNWIYVQKKNPATLRLLIGGQIFTNVTPSSIGPSSQEYVNFVLQVGTADSEDWKAWAAIVDASRHNEDGFNLPISVAVGTTREVFESNAYVKVVPYPPRWYYLLALFVLLLAALIYLAADTDLLRYSIGGRPSSPLRSPLSLGLVQMAFWFYLVVAAYTYICVTTHQVHIPMGSVLGLLGISSTTGLAAIFVDKQKEGTAQDQRNTLIVEQAALNARVKDLVSTGVLAGSAAEKELFDKKSRLAQVDALVAQLPAPAPPPTSKGFIVDLLNDGDGVSFHRFQIAVWTIVLGTVFAWSVYRNMSMPEFDPSLLTLMGISSGTYVGFKFPEKLKT